MNLPPFTRTVIPPKSGWKPSTYYVVEVASTRNNPIHRAIFYSGFLNGKNNGPGGYNAIWSATGWEGVSIDTVHYLKVISVIKGM